MRTRFSAGVPIGIAMVLALGVLPALRADDAAPASPSAPTMQDYQSRDTPSATPAAPSASGMESLAPASPSPSPAPSITKPEDDNWLLKGVEAERKANGSRANPSGQPQASPLKPVDPLNRLNPEKPLPLPAIQALPNDDSARPKPIKPPDGISPLVPAASRSADANQYQPLIKGLSSDAVKPLATSGGSSTNSPSALSSFKAVEPINPDVTRPLYLDPPARTDSSSPLYGAASVPSGAPGMGATPGYDIPNAPSSRPMGMAPGSLAAPMSPTAPQARPAGSGALSAFAPIQPITIPTAPAAPSAPTARDIAPKAGPGSAIKVKDPVSADLPFIR